LKINDRVQVVPTLRLSPQLLVWVTSDGSFPDIVGAEIVTTAEVVLVMRTFAGKLSVSTGSPGKKTSERDTLIVGVGSAGETYHQVVATPVGARESLQLDGMPEPIGSN
jgi:hypothetical protein